MVLVVVIAIGATVAALGCAGDDGSSPPAEARSDQVESPAGDRIDKDERPSALPTTEAEEAPEPNTETGQKVIRKKSGAVTITPERPTSYRTRPGKGCVMKEFGLPTGGSKRFAMPPRPGVAARRVDDGTVIVSYDLGAVDPRCRPAFLQLTLDINDDGQSGAGTHARIRKPRGEISMAAPGHMREADVFIASVRTSDGLPSESSKVLIDE